MGKLASVLLPLLTLGAVVGCQEILDASMSTNGPFISNLRSAWRSLNSCEVRDGQAPGSLLVVTFQFVDDDSTVADGDIATVELTFQPSGSSFSNLRNRTTIRGNGRRGDAEFTHCLRFGDQTSVDLGVRFSDSDDAVSNTLRTSIPRPQDGNIEVDSGRIRRSVP
jgi:hypothetical protein